MDFSSLLPWLFAIILLFLPFLYFLLPSKQKGKAYNFPPSPPRLPVIGNLHQLGKIPHYSLWKLSHNYGPIMLLQLGQVPTLVVSSPKLAKDVLKTYDLDCCTRPMSRGQKKISYNFLDLAFCPYGEYWREMRKMCVMELFTSRRVQSYWKIREEEVKNLIDTIMRGAPSPVQMDDTMFNLTNSVICRVAFGTSHYKGTNQFENGQIKEIVADSMILLSGFSASDLFPSSVGWIIDLITGLHWKLERCFRNFDAFFQKVLDEHLDPSRPRPENDDIIDVMLGLAQDRTTVLKLNKEHIKAILVDIFLGAVDTSSCTSVWLMAELARNPRVMKKVQEEIRNCMGRKPFVEETELEKLKYVKLVVKETLRLHPPTSMLLPRETIRKCKIGGYDVLPKTRVLVNVWAIGRDPQIWENPQDFYPERFEGKEYYDFKGQSFEYLPFRSGRRSCPGMTMGLTSVMFNIANLLHCFDWKLPNGMKPEEINMEEEFGLNIRNKVPLYLVPVKYNWESYKT